MPQTILVIDDERDLLELVRYNLEKAGLGVICASDGASGLQIAARHDVDLVILDIMMPGTDGLEVCRRLRTDHRTARIPVIILTAKVSETDRVVGLELGADDYITKPFSPRELLARVRAVLRRSAMQEQSPAVINHGDLVIDVLRHEVSSVGKTVSLTATEFRILHFLAARPGRVFSRAQIIDGALGGEADVFDRTVDVHVTSIRRKLGRGSGRIQTVRGFGYKFKDTLET